MALSAVGNRKLCVTPCACISSNASAGAKQTAFDDYSDAFDDVLAVFHEAGVDSDLVRDARYAFQALSYEFPRWHNAAATPARSTPARTEPPTRSAAPPAAARAPQVASRPVVDFDAYRERLQSFAGRYPQLGAEQRHLAPQHAVHRRQRRTLQQAEQAAEQRAAAGTEGGQQQAATTGLVCSKVHAAISLRWRGSAHSAAAASLNATGRPT